MKMTEKSTFIEDLSLENLLQKSLFFQSLPRKTLWPAKDSAASQDEPWDHK